MKDKTPTFNKVVMAYVATLLLGSDIKPSRSTLHVDTAAGCVRERAASVRVAANFRTAFGDDKNSCKTRNECNGVAEMGINW
jgi:hypothetical protein